MLLEKAIERRSLKPQIIDGYGNSFINQLRLNESQLEDAVSLACDTSRHGCKVLASYTLPSGIHKILFELAVTFEDGTEGSVVMPIVIDQDNYDYTYTSDANKYTRGRVSWLSRYLKGGLVDSINITTHLLPGSKAQSNPEIEKLNIAFEEGSRTQELLNKMYQLAADGKMLSQDEINQLKDALIWH